MTIREKINKILEYCKYTKQLAINAGGDVRYLVGIENTGGEKQCAESNDIGYVGDNTTFLHDVICQAVLVVKQYSQNYNCLSSVKVYIETYNSEGKLIDEDPIDEYEINFENGIEVQ